MVYHKSKVVLAKEKTETALKEKANQVIHK
jgi:hypothetical protein